MALADLRVGKKGLPKGLETIRIVRIAGLESNACCGTHVRSLGTSSVSRWSW
jgi:Ser-tRNA(Ala) deacylase AlaX